MKLYRDILIFPKFKNIEEIEKIRKNNDKLYGIIPPHITIVFPFFDDISNEELIYKLKEILNSYNSFNVVFKGISLSNDNYIFLNCDIGKEILSNMHDEIYEKILPKHLKNIKYVPHITLGQSNTIDFLKDFNKEFSCKIDKILVEEIGLNDESNIICEINLK